MEQIDSEHFASLAGTGIYSHIANSQHSKPFHDYVEKSIKHTIGDFNNPYMDAVSGKHHRWKHGHDLLDVLGGADDPLGKGKAGFGHLATDLFTKDGLPLPGMSKEYLGSGMVKTLESLGVEKPIKWLNMNGFDHLFGGISLIEAGDDLSQALSAEVVDFTWETAFDTFGEGTLEIYFGLETANVWLVASGVMEYVSGSIMLYKDLTYVEPTLTEQIIDNLPTQSEIVSALGFYIMASSLKNYISFSRGRITQDEVVKNTITDVSVSLSSFTITKSLIATLATGATGGMLLPILIGGGSSLLLRQLFKMAFPTNPILITESELWEQSPFEYNSPWSKSVFNNGNTWNNSIFDNKDNNPWQESIFKKQDEIIKIGISSKPNKT